MLRNGFHLSMTMSRILLLFMSQPGIELRHTGLRAVVATEPDRPPANQVADHNAVVVALADCDLVDANCLGSLCAGALDLGAHVLHLQRLDRVPGELQFLGDIADRSLPAAAADIERKAPGEVRIVCQEIWPFALHGSACAARHATHVDLQDDAEPRARKIANTPRRAACVRKSKRYPSNRRRCVLPDCLMLHHAGFRDSSKPRKPNVHVCFRCHDAAESPTQIMEHP